MDATARLVEWNRLWTWNRAWALAVGFGLVSMPWTYGFVAGLRIPLWPAFIGSATVFAAGAGLDGLVRGSASNLVGIAYGAATLAVVDASGTGVVGLSLAVGGFMLLASLHAFVPLLSFVPGGFLGFATLFSVTAADATAFGLAGLPGQTVAAVVAMLIGAVIGVLTDEASGRLA